LNYVLDKWIKTSDRDIFFAIMKIDSHQHFWLYDPEDYIWITEELAVLKKNFTPSELKPLLDEAGMDGCISVQARQNRIENEFLLKFSEKLGFVKGVVGWVDLQADDVEKDLEELSERAKFVGLRHVIQDEPDDRFILGQKFMAGIGLLEKFNLTYDILVLEKHLPYTVEFAQKFPNQKFVLDHMGKPGVKDGRIDEWKAGVEKLAKLENVYCKLSGLVTEADWAKWKEKDFIPYMDTVMEAFGATRVMVGSDWPVCTLASKYSSVIDIAKRYVEKLSSSEQEAVMGGNAARFYGID